LASGTFGKLVVLLHSRRILNPVIFPHRAPDSIQLAQQLISALTPHYIRVFRLYNIISQHPLNFRPHPHNVANGFTWIKVILRLNRINQAQGIVKRELDVGEEGGGDVRHQ
jgi:hypothetical protein